MAHPDIERIKALLNSGNKKQAFSLLKQHLKQSPTADGWYLAATMTKDRDNQINFLRKSLAIDEWHTASNRLLHKIEGASPANPHREKTDWDKQTGAKNIDDIERKKKADRSTRRDQKRGGRARLGCLFSLGLSLIISFIAMRAGGLLPTAIMGTINTLTGVPTPVSQIDGIPLSQVDNAVYLLKPVLSKVAQERSIEIVDNGYLHEHTFYAYAGQQYAIYVQFISLSAKHVSRNVALLDPNGQDGTNRCRRDHILQGDTNLALVCLIDISGDWRIRVLGREGESVGAYFVGVVKMQ